MGSYHDLRAWQSADALAVAVFALADRSWSPRHAAVWHQLRRAVLSISLNIAEGYAQGPGRRCRWHFRVAYGSAIETGALLEFLDRLGIDTGSIPALADSSRALTYRLWQRSRQ